MVVGGVSMLEGVVLKVAEPLGIVCVGECMVVGGVSVLEGVVLKVAEKLSKGVRSV